MSENGAVIAKSFLFMLTNTQIYHWQTKSYNKHVAAGKFYEAIQPLVDKFMETFQGRYGIVRYEPFNMRFDNISDAEFMVLLKQFVVFLNDDIPKVVPSQNSDLLNIRDELLGETHHVMYFLNQQ